MTWPTTASEQTGAIVLILFAVIIFIIIGLWLGCKLPSSSKSLKYCPSSPSPTPVSDS